MPSVAVEQRPLSRRQQKEEENQVKRNTYVITVGDDQLIHRLRVDFMSTIGTNVDDSEIIRAGLHFLNQASRKDASDIVAELVKEKAERRRKARAEKSKLVG